jgi:hypothetical protein
MAVATSVPLPLSVTVNAVMPVWPGFATNTADAADGYVRDGSPDDESSGRDGVTGCVGGAPEQASHRAAGVDREK